MAFGIKGFTNPNDPVTDLLLKRQPGVNTAQGGTASTGVTTPPPTGVPLEPSTLDRGGPLTGTPAPVYQDIAYWQNKGYGTNDMFDANGQTKPGWSRTGKGYEFTPSTGWGTPPPLTAGQSIYTPDQVNSFLSYYSTQPGVIASVGENPAYWVKRIGETGGLNPGNVNFWVNLMKRPEGSPEGGTAAGGGFGGGTPVSFPTIGAGVAGGEKGSQLFDLLMKRAQAAETVDPNDPTIKARTNAYGADQTRQMRHYLSDLAEKQGPNTNIGAETRLANESVGQSTSKFAADLVAQELSARRDQIEKALSGAPGLLTSEQQMQLQEELAQIGLQLQESQFSRNLAQNAFQFDTNSNFRGLGL